MKKNSFGFSKKEYKSIQNILRKAPTSTETIIFGSRARGNFKKGSDVDLALKGTNIPDIIPFLKNEFEESTLPYFFDLIDYENISNEILKKEIDLEGVKI